MHAMIDALSTAPQRAGEAADEWCWPSALVGGGAALGESVDACASAAGELGLSRVGPVAAAAAVRRGGMACAAKKVRQPPEARPCVAWSTVC